MPRTKAATTAASAQRKAAGKAASQLSMEQMKQLISTAEVSAVLARMAVPVPGKSAKQPKKPVAADAPLSAAEFRREVDAESAASSSSSSSKKKRKSQAAEAKEEEEHEAEAAQPRRKKHTLSRAIRAIIRERRPKDNEYDLIFPQRPFQRLVKEIMSNPNIVPPSAAEFKVQKLAYLALQGASEAMLQDLFARTDTHCVNGRRQTILPIDFRTAVQAVFPQTTENSHICSADVMEAVAEVEDKYLLLAMERKREQEEADPQHHQIHRNPLLSRLYARDLEHRTRIAEQARDEKLERRRILREAEEKKKKKALLRAAEEKKEKKSSKDADDGNGDPAAAASSSSSSASASAKGTKRKRAAEKDASSSGSSTAKDGEASQGGAVPMDTDQQPAAEAEEAKEEEEGEEDDDEVADTEAEEVDEAQAEAEDAAAGDEEPLDSESLVTEEVAQPVAKKARTEPVTVGTATTVAS